MMLALEGATAMDPIDAMGWSSKIDFQLWPASVDFQTPPEAVAALKVRWSPGTPTARETRPPAAGPRRRNFRYLSSGGPPPGFNSGSSPTAKGSPTKMLQSAATQMPARMPM